VKRWLAVVLVLVVTCSTACWLAQTKAALWGFLGVGQRDNFACPVDAVVVLGAGYYTKADRLNGESILRLAKGVQVFQECNAKWLVVSGRLGWARKERHAELMRDLAVAMGIPQQRIVMETESLNTQEHPIRLKAMGFLDSESRLVVVTSPWHLRRALIEFRRVFPDVSAAPSYFFSPELSEKLVVWLPMLRQLDLSTMLHEYAGILWYGLIRRWI